MQRSLHLKTIPSSHFQSEPHLYERLHAIAALSYVDPDFLLAEAFEKSTQVDLGLVGDELVAFLLSDDEQLSHTCWIYLHLLVSNPTRRGSVVLWHLLHERHKQTNRWLNKIHMDGWYVGTTANPVVLQMLQRFADPLIPQVSGVISNEERLQVELLRQRRFSVHLKSHLQDDSPLVLRRFAKARYTKAETDRIQARTQSQKNCIDILKVRETDGDRVIFMGKVKRH